MKKLIGLRSVFDWKDLFCNLTKQKI